MLIEYVCVYNSCLSYIQEEHTAVMNLIFRIMYIMYRVSLR